MNMEASLPWLFAAIVGFGHAFEADHLLAVSNIVTRRKNLTLAIKDGIYWGLGHTSTIFLLGLLVIVGRVSFPDAYFGYFESVVGLMLVILGIFRLYQHYMRRPHFHTTGNTEELHQVAYGVGLVHGLAGSGAMILLVMTEVQGGFNSLMYLLIFGIGSVAGMLLAAGIFSLPFSRRLSDNETLQWILIILSSLLCMIYGGYIFFENL
jgi:hypothetical protein